MMMLRFLLVALCVAASVCQSSINFLDCTVQQDSWSIWRQCCKSDQLPNGCECFDISFWSDFRNSVYHLPRCPPLLDVKFYFFDRESNGTAVDIRSGQILNAPFKGTRGTVFITHGYNDRPTVSWAENMRNELLAEDDFNVIVVDWEQASSGGNYPQVVANTRSVGAMLARLILDLHTLASAPLQSFHLVGHSLGAHISGIAGKEVERLTGGKLGRITGLDPAGLSFESYSANVRLDKSDASFVDVIHTDAEPLVSSGFGIRISIGHVDFWPNGGQHQPECPPETYGILGLLNFEADINTMACSHGRCLDLFTNSISTCRYDPQGACTMGYHTSTECRGDYYPNTTSHAPYC